MTSYLSKQNSSLHQNSLKKGITTGSCATATAKAALLAEYSGEYPKEVTIITPEEKKLTIPIAAYGFRTNDKKSAWVRKDAGDDSDITHGTLIGAKVKLTKDREIVIDGGQGVGQVTKPGLPVEVGQAAINPGPKQMIVNNLREFLPKDKGVSITITVPKGEQLAEKTLNSKLGIVKGISILGTTGIVEPMSTQAMKESLKIQLPQINQLKQDTLVIVPGRSGEKIALSRGVNGDCIAIVGNYIGYMIRNAMKYDFTKILLLGHIGKLAKLSAGIFNTYSKTADARREIFVTHAALKGFSNPVIDQLWESVTAEESVNILLNHDETTGSNQGDRTLKSIAQEAEHRVSELTGPDHQVGVLLTNRPGKIIAWGNGAKDICYSKGWDVWERLS
ncbi:cobalt-precorrin-5B (C(1))-methyltransferase CbiD [Natranaerobius thermophilus]|uniref:Cobalt-precorrin-5B C(1)-methyltransferase n=1 Tax=Natranaerobius thermophilus (strain ATCC BAA-1301 / DSM 18059 / JW/NM-WN-LF) TaxID=457570 RepID=B2A0F4_NATTJ|nr:cobalt-precorrin-5B (C(1))-methyltransferase CbiD [Natranaerobius thermophilus]ACB84515.1 cobalamin biosynthesis protein CbiD [Natranaerobius thermophilus JW/NM-WN-LF]